MGPKWTEASVVMRARRSLGFGIDVEVETVVTVGAGLGSGVVRAFWHSSQVVFVKELACLAFLAQTSQPMFAYEIVVG